MGGCFGNSPFDRAMENQLFQHLESEAEVDSYFEKVSEAIGDDLWESDLDFFDSIGEETSDFTDWITVFLYYHVEPMVAAKACEVLYKRTLKN